MGNNHPPGLRCAAGERYPMEPVDKSAGALNGDATDNYFRELVAAGEEPLLRETVGTLLINLVEGEQTSHSLVKIDKGKVAVLRRASGGEAIIQCERDLFNKMVEGRKNAMAALLRGEISLGGNLALVSAFVRLFPGPLQSQKTFMEREIKRSR